MFAVKKEDFHCEFDNFFTYKRKINLELKRNGSSDIEILLLYYSIPDTIDILLSRSLIFQSLCEDSKATSSFQNYFLHVKEIYQKSFTLPNRQTLYTLIEKSNVNTESIKPKSHISFGQQQNKEEYMKDILKRLKDCVNLYYSAYYNREIEVELSNGEYLYLKFFEKNLPHLLGISKNQILSNPETKRILKIDDDQYPDEEIFDKNGIYLYTKKNNCISSIQILEKIIADLEGKQYIIDETFQKRVKKEQKRRKSDKIYSQQFQDHIQMELLPFDKIDLKTRMFLSDSPYENPSIFINLAPKQKLTKYNDLCSRVRISKSAFTILKKPNRKNIIHHDYVFTGYGTTNNPCQRAPISLVLGPNAEKYKWKFKGQIPHSAISITSPINGNKTFFNPRQQVDMYFNLLNDFNDKNGMDLVTLGEELKVFLEHYENRIKKEMKKRQKKMLSLKSKAQDQK